MGPSLRALLLLAARLLALLFVCQKAGHPVHNSFLILLVFILLNLRRHPSLFLPTARMNQKIVRSFPSSMCFVGRVSERLDV